MKTTNSLLSPPIPFFPQSHYHFLIPESSTSFLSQRGPGNGGSDQSKRNRLCHAFILTFSLSSTVYLPHRLQFFRNCSYLLMRVVHGPSHRGHPCSIFLPTLSHSPDKYNLHINFTHTAYSKITFSWTFKTYSTSKWKYMKQYKPSILLLTTEH